MTAKKLSESDFETGMAMERRMQAAMESLKMANAAYQCFVEILRERYGAPAPNWTIEDWAVGFVPVVIEGDADGRPNNT